MHTVSVDRDGVQLHVQIDGASSPDAPTVVFANALGTTLDVWDAVLPALPDGIRTIRYDLRGHGLSDVPAGPYSMGQLVSDAAAVCDTCDVRDAMFVGLSVGGMVAQGVAVKRPDLIRALVLSNTAAKIGNPAQWQVRIDTALTKGMDALIEEVMLRWTGRLMLSSGETSALHDMVLRCDPVGYAGVCAAISGTDFYTPTSGIRIPTLGIAGSEDGSTPPDLVRETIDLIPGAQFQILRRAGHIPCVQTPAAFADLLNNFIIGTGHLNSRLS